MTRPADGATLDAVEAFFRSRGAAVDHEVSPLALGEPLPLLSGRGYVPIELTDVMFRPLTDADDAGPDPAITITTAGPDAGDTWAHAAADGWSEFPEVVPFVRALGAVEEG